MKRFLRKLGPLATVIAAMVYLCAEHVSGTTAAVAKTGEKITRLDRRLLQPSLPPVCERDPFTRVPQLCQSELVHQPRQQVATSAEESVQKEPAGTPIAQLAKLKLRGIYLSGPRKSALVNDELCFEGERLAQEVPGTSAYILARVERDYVVLHTTDGELQLGYDGITVRERPSTSAEFRHTRQNP